MPLLCCILVRWSAVCKRAAPVSPPWLSQTSTQPARTTGLRSAGSVGRSGRQGCQPDVRFRAGVLGADRGGVAERTKAAVLKIHALRVAPCFPIWRCATASAAASVSVSTHSAASHPVIGSTLPKCCQRLVSTPKLTPPYRGSVKGGGHMYGWVRVAGRTRELVLRSRGRASVPSRKSRRQGMMRALAPGWSNAPSTTTV